MIINYETLIDTIVSAMREQAIEANTSKAEVDISGGVDSAVVAALSCRAFGPENVVGVYSSINSSPESLSRARLVAGKFGFNLVELDLSNVFGEICALVLKEFNRLNIPVPTQEENPTAFGGLRSCLRAPVGRFVNRVFGGGIRQGTGNMDEDELIRFYQKGGDGEVDCNWIEGLYKSEVWELAKYLGVPQEIIDAKPTPDLWGIGATHNDEDELKELTGVALTYTRPGEQMGTIEWASRENAKTGIITGGKKHIKIEELNYPEEQLKVISAIRKMERITRHKAEAPPYIPRQLLLAKGCVE